MQCELHWVEVIKLDNRTVEVIKFNDNNTIIKKYYLLKS